MLSLQPPMFTLCISLGIVTSAAASILVSGYEGREVNVSCSYGVGYESYEKYLCKNDCGSDDVLIRTTETKRDRFSIRDNRQTQVFTTTISALSLRDAGKYWCGLTRTGIDTYTEVKLEVEQDSCCDKVTKVQGHNGGSVSISCPYEPESRNSVKYMCRGKQPSVCLQQALITSDNSTDGQFTLSDDTLRSFTVTIGTLTQGDSGSYLCGVRRGNSYDVFSAVGLEVKEWCCEELNQMSGIVGHQVTFECPYPPQHRDNRKFLCKGKHRHNCTDMVTSQSRFALQDEVSLGFFLVAITKLEADDAGTYWCVSDPQWSPGNYSKIQLSVVFPQQSSTVTSAISAVEPVGTQSTHVPFAAVVFIVPTVLLVLILALVMVYKCKCRKTKGARVKMDRSKTRPARAADTVDVEDIYVNGDVVACSKLGNSKQRRAGNQYDDTGEEQQGSDYQNLDTTEDIYCNQQYIQT